MSGVHNGNRGRFYNGRIVVIQRTLKTNLQKKHTLSQWERAKEKELTHAPSLRLQTTPGEMICSISIVINTTHYRGHDRGQLDRVQRLLRRAQRGPKWFTHTYTHTHTHKKDQVMWSLGIHFEAQHLVAHQLYSRLGRRNLYRANPS